MTQERPSIVIFRELLENIGAAPSPPNGNGSSDIRSRCPRCQLSRPTLIATPTTLDPGVILRCSSGCSPADIMDAAVAAQAAHRKIKPAPPPLLAVDSLHLLQMPCEEAEQILGPFHEADVCMLSAWRGTGKTLFGLSIAVAVAAGVPFLGWEAPSKSRKVLYIDGEMPLPLIRAHLWTALHSFGPDLEYDPANLVIVTPDLQPDGWRPSIATEEGVERLFDLIDLHRPAFLQMDNLSCLGPTGAENDPEIYEIVRNAQLAMRRLKLASLLHHHTAKAGDQRGHSGKEDILDLSLRLERYPDHDPSAGARFRLTYPKMRRHVPGVGQTLDCHLHPGGLGGKMPHWQVRTDQETADDLTREMLDQGMPVRDIVKALREQGINRSSKTVYNVKKGIS